MASNDSKESQSPSQDNRYAFVLDYAGVLDHAPATSQGTFLDGSNEGVESLEEYQDGGYHPVHLGDTFGPSGRYKVIHKLGHGGFGTVWLCRDSVDARYVALKVLASELNSDDLLDLTLAELDHSHPGAKYIATPLDHFSFEGPNGVHYCLVLPVLGPCVSPDLWELLDKDAGSALRRFAHQSTQALDFLHKKQICHGDFRPANILVKLKSLDHLSEDELLAKTGQPTKVSVRTESEELPSSCPEYLVRRADMSKLGNEHLTDEICVIDFGESFTFSFPPEALGIPENYLPPEVLLDLPDVVGPACDLWALGCTLFEIREQIPLFYMIYDNDELLAEMAQFFGKFPEEYFDESGKWLRKEEVWSLEVALSKPVEIFDSGEDYKKGPKKSMITPVPEQNVLADLLYKLFQYVPEKRISAGEALQHGWLL